MAEDSPATQLISVEINFPEFAELINDIRAFDWSIITKLRKEDLARVSSAGFKFTTKGFENQKMELKSFLLHHPSCMASDFEMVINKLVFYFQFMEMKSQVYTPPPPQPTVRPAITARSKPKRQKRIVYEVEEESYEEDFEEEEEEKPKRKARKARRGPRDRVYL